MSDILKDLGLAPVINASGPWTVMGNATLSAPVIQAMTQAARLQVPMAELQARAGEIIAEATGAESGYATSSASAGITLSVAACLTGPDGARMIALPQRLEPPNHVALFSAHRGYYDVAIRATGARLRPVPHGERALPALASALDGSVACVFYDCTGLPFKDQTGVPPLADVVAVAHQAGVPVVADASLAIPPAENLRAVVATGADAVVFTGGKSLQGPAASGFVACRKPIATAIAIQHQDVDILEKTGATPPDGPGKYMGLGRGLKVGKEQICGMLAALRDFQSRDHEADAIARRARLEEISAAMGDIPGLGTQRLFSNEGRPPYLILSFDETYPGNAARRISEQLLAGSPRVFVADRPRNTLILGAECLSEQEVPLVGRALRAAIMGVQAR